MEILDRDNNLESKLNDVKNEDVFIITAFAIKTESIVDTLLENNNKIHFILGTINYFSDPVFIEYCVNLAENNSNFKFYVDFRINNSVHWKLYLISPNQVIIGSANLTNKGISLERDTCLSITNKEVFQEYKRRFEELIKIHGVISFNNKEFNVKFEEYKIKHRLSQSNRLRIKYNAKNSNSLSEWLDEELNQLIPLFIWDGLRSKEENQKGERIFEENEDTETNYRDLFTTYVAADEFPYKEGDNVLCMNKNGSYADFYIFDRIIYQDETYWIYSFKRPRYERPFKLTDDIKRNIRKYAGDWSKRDLIALNHKELAKLL